MRRCKIQRDFANLERISALFTKVHSVKRLLFDLKLRRDRSLAWKVKIPLHQFDPVAHIPGLIYQCPGFGGARIVSIKNGGRGRRVISSNKQTKKSKNVSEKVIVCSVQQIKISGDGCVVSVLY